MLLLEVQVIKEMILDYNNYDEEETILMANEILRLIDDNTCEFSQLVQMAIEELAYNTGRCPCCGKLLTPITYSEDRGEYLGFPTEENMTRSVCNNPDCGNY